MNPILPNTPLARLLQAVPGCRPLLIQLGVDPDAGPDRSLAEVCRANDLDPPTVSRLLLAFAKTTIPPPPAVPAQLMLLSELCDHLEQPRQAGLHDELGKLERMTRSAARQEGAANPQLLAIREAFVALRAQLVAHLLAEAENLFPMIRQLATGDTRDRPSRLALESRLARMEHEHDQVDEALAELGQLVADPTLTDRIPAVMQPIADALVRLEQTVHEQIYHENQVLFPRALACESPP